MIKLAIVDDHQLFLKGISSLFIENNDIEIIGSFENGLKFIEGLDPQNLPNVVLLDLSMPEMDGFEVLNILKSKYPSVKPIALSMHEDANYIVKCVRNGAYGYLLKNTDEKDLFEAILEVYQGRKYFKGEIAEKMLNFVMVEPDKLKKLTKKETEVLSLIADGKTNSDIADQLFISERTVETHRANILKKLEAKNTAELIKKAYQLNLIN
jgi:two-component system, NarL family, response regulator NreC